MSRHSTVDELLGAYALGAVSEGEAIIVRDHVATCADCSSNLQRLAAVAAVLPLAVEQVEPPASLRRRLMARVNAEADAKILNLPPTPTGTGVAPDVDDLRVRRLWRQPRPWVPGAVAAAFIATLLAWNVALQQQLTNPGHAPAANSVATGTMTDARNQRLGTITYLAQDRVAVVSLHSLQAPSAGRVYELWLIEANGHARPAGLFAPEADGTKLLLVPRQIGPKDMIAVTDEPLTGSQGPTSPPIITGHI